MGNPHTEESQPQESEAGLREYAATRLDQFKRFVDSNLRLFRSGSLLVLGGSAVFFFLRSRAVSEGATAPQLASGVDISRHTDATVSFCNRHSSILLEFTEVSPRATDS